jgi:hypothetical protein
MLYYYKGNPIVLKSCFHLRDLERGSNFLLERDNVTSSKKGTMIMYEGHYQKQSSSILGAGEFPLADRSKQLILPLDPFFVPSSSIQYQNADSHLQFRSSLFVGLLNLRSSALTGNNTVRSSLFSRQEYI